MTTTCKKCKLHLTAKTPNINSSIPNGEVPLAFVAEAPGEVEEELGKPLVGPAGQNLEMAFKTLGIEREKVLIGNCVRCRPPNNRIPTIKEIKACSDKIIDEIIRYKPRVIICLGRIATSVLLKMKDVKLGTIRGSVFNGLPVFGYRCLIIPTWHPSPRTFVHTPERKLQMLSDIQKGFELSKTVTDTNTLDNDRFCCAITSLASWEQVKQDLFSSDIISFDLETTGLDFMDSKAAITNIGLCATSNFGVSIIVSDYQWDKSEFDAVLKDVQTLLLSKKIIGHHLPFDAKYMRKIYGFWPKIWYWDTALAHAVLRPGESAKLKTISYQYTNMGGYEHEVVVKGGVLKLNAFERAEYNVNDCICVYRIYKKQKEIFDKNNLTQIMDNIIMPAAEALSDMEYIGIAVSEYKLASLKTKYLEIIRGIKDQLYLEPVVRLYNSVKKPFNPQSPAQASELLFGKAFCNYPVVKFTGKGETPSCDKQTLQILSRQGSQIASLILNYRQYTKLVSTYVVGLSEKIVNGRVHTHFHQDVSISGRTSCSNPALHQIPKESEIRSVFVADPGFLFVDADYKQMELVVSTFFTKDEIMINAIRSGDAHRYIARLIFGFSDDQITEEKRRFIKTLNFGVLYGMGPKKLADSLNISEDRSRELINEYFKILKKTKEWIEAIRNQAATKGYVVSMFGRPRFYLTSEQAKNKIGTDERQIDYNSAVNHPIQSTASDLMLIGLNLWRRFLIKNNRYLSDAYIVLQIHDEILSCVRNEYVKELSFLKKQILESVRFDFFTLPLQVDVRIGGDWGSCVEIDT